MKVKASELVSGDKINIPVNMGTAFNEIIVQATDNDEHETTVFYENDRSIIFSRDELVDVLNATAGVVMFEIDGVEYSAVIHERKPEGLSVVFGGPSSALWMGQPARTDGE